MSQPLNRNDSALRTHEIGDLIVRYFIVSPSIVTKPIKRCAELTVVESNKPAIINLLNGTSTDKLLGFRNEVRTRR